MTKLLAPLLAALITCSAVQGQDGPRTGGLKSPDKLARLACIRELGEAGPKATSALGELIIVLQKEPEVDLRLAILDSLVAISPGDRSVVDALVASFADEHYKVFYQAVGHLILMDEKVVPVLASAMAAQNKDVRRGASLTLAYFRGDISAAIPALKKALSDPGEKLNAASAFIKLGPKALPALPELVGLLSDPDAGTNAAHALGAIGRPAIPSLVTSLQDKNVKIRERSALALRVMGPQAKDAIPALRKALNDSDPNVRFWAASALEGLDAK
jgi:HEAT repeat protein